MKLTFTVVLDKDTGAGREVELSTSAEVAQAQFCFDVIKYYKEMYGKFWIV